MAKGARLGDEFGDHVLVSRVEKQLNMSEEKISATEISRESSLRQRCANMIPGLIDHVTMGEIFARVPWTMLWGFSLVSRAWRREFENRHVYDSRGVFLKSTRETFVALIHCDSIFPDDEIEEEYAISLYDVQRDLWNLLPELPFGTKGRSILRNFKCIILDGRLYVLGGEDENRQVRADVYMMDLAACRRVWQKCASMSRSRSHFACHVLDGKIYVLGGSLFPKEAEVYDPSENLWSPVAHMLHNSRFHSLGVLGRELYVYWDLTICADTKYLEEKMKKFVESYNPQSNDWSRKQMTLPIHQHDERSRVLLVVNEQLYILWCEQMYILWWSGVVLLKLSLYDVESNSWIYQNRDGHLPHDLYGNRVHLIEAVAVGVEVMVKVIELREDSHMHRDHLHRSYILKSRGFSNKEGSIFWERVSSPRLFGQFQLSQAFQM